MGQVHFENFDFLVKVKSPLGQSIFFFFFFFLFFFFLNFLQPVRTGSGFQVGPGRSGQTGQPVVEDDVIHDVIARVYHGIEVPARVSA